MAGVLPLLLMAALGCSKTEDKAAEKRVFGDPPRFTAQPKVDPIPGDQVVPCDVTGGALAWADANYGDEFRLDPTPITVSMEYTEVSITAQVDDPQGKGDILGVFAQYTPKYSKNRYVVVLLDDGTHDCSMTSGPNKQPPTGCFASPPNGAVAVLQTCSTSTIMKPEVVCDYDPTRAACKKETTCLDAECHVNQKCDPPTWRCLCGGPCDDLGTWTYCTGVQRMDLAGACTGATIKCGQDDGNGNVIPPLVDPAGYQICDNRFEDEPLLTSCKPEPEHCVDIVHSADVPTCQATTQFVTTADAQAGDGTFTRKFAVANLRTAGQGGGLAQDCVVSQVHQTPILLETADTLDFSLEVVDRSANDTVWPTTFPVKPNAAKFLCNGDACMCCILEKGENGTPYIPGGGGGCAGAPGMVGVRFTNGYCNDCLGSNDPLACCPQCSVKAGHTTCRPTDDLTSFPECEHPE